ncbi:hypothetical protein PHPALM_31424 [Phytophthora palmivora]|uniref:Uncharacterized protein n=1 Tax=Phytophthora palmivora TaxID=4796 RepID=A0A2P4X2L2_9STRA|nr:hypothetical protein PHPALM_31424 [Phytophthora palmivora]
MVTVATIQDIVITYEMVTVFGIIHTTGRHMTPRRILLTLSPLGGGSQDSDSHIALLKNVPVVT